jgi:hypothetical protein
MSSEYVRIWKATVCLAALTETEEEDEKAQDISMYYQDWNRGTPEWT